MIASKEYVTKIMEEKSLFPKKKFSQNFLIDVDIAQNIVNELGDIHNQLVFEIGSGLGGLTEILLNKGARVICSEIDYRLCEHLKKTFSMFPTFSLLEGNFLKIKKETFPKEPIKVISNLPYAETTAILEKILSQMKQCSEIVFMVQKEVSSRLEAKSKNKESSPLSCFFEYLGDLKRCFNVSRNAFYPLPHVDSLIYRFEFKNHHEDDEKFFRFLKQCFMLRRKTLVNNLLSLYEKENVSECLTKIGLPLNIRPEEITVDQFYQLFKLLH